MKTNPSYIKILKEHTELVLPHTTDLLIDIQEHKRCNQVIWLSNYYDINWMYTFNFPFLYSNVGSYIGLRGFFNSKIILTTEHVANSKYYDWKLQEERNKIKKLHQLTGIHHD